MLTLRRQPHDIDGRFWLVLCGHVPIGAIVQPGGVGHWHWSITVQGNAATTSSGKADSREAAMADFRAAWVRLGQDFGSEGWKRHVAHMATLEERAKGW